MNLLSSWSNDGKMSPATAIGADAERWSAALPVASGSLAVCETQPPRALLFELENVLYDGTLWQRWLWQLMTRLGWQRDFRSFTSIWQRGYLQEVYCGCREFSEALRAFLVDSGLTPGQIDEVEASSSARRREFAETIRPLPGVIKTLSRLASAGIVLGVLANSEVNADELKMRLERLSLAGRFRFVISSRDLQHAKPEPACYQAALDSLKLPACEVAVVSYSAHDLAGAKAVGLQAYALNADRGTPADFSLHRFDELLARCAPLVAAAAD
jgi:HAD superfamily hydrolase (TIGR01509 family)